MLQSSMATIKDVAKLAGVGVGTVSRVLNGGMHVSVSAREKVAEAARVLNFRPNAAARRLVRADYASHAVGIIMPAAAHPFYMEILRGIDKVLRERSMHLMVFHLDDNEDALIRHVLDENPAGIIMIAHPLTDSSLEQIRLHRTTLVFVDYKHPDFPSFSIDNFNGGCLAAEFLLENHTQRPAYIGDATDSLQQSERFRGFSEILKKNGVVLHKEMRVKVSEKNGYLATETMLRAGCDAIFYFCDELAYGGLDFLRKSGLVLPVIGYDDRAPSRYLGLSTIRQSAEKMGEEAAEALFDYRPGRVREPELIRRMIILQNFAGET